MEVLGVQYATVDEDTATVIPNGNDAMLVEVNTDGILDLSPTDSETASVQDIMEYQTPYDDANSIPEVASEDTYMADNNLPDYTNDASMDNFTMG